MPNLYSSDDQSKDLGDAADTPAVDVALDQDDAPSGDTNIIVDPETGDVTVDLSPQGSDEEDDSFDANLALTISVEELGRISNELLQGIEADDSSRDQWVRQFDKGISLLGIKIEEPRGDVGTTSSPVDGMSVVRHPVLTEAVIRFNANSMGEFLPSGGPVKSEVIGEATAEDNTLAEALADDLNYYLTDIATEYAPDKDSQTMVLGFGGLAYTKGYHCPIKRRPTLACVAPKDLIVSETATDLQTAQRVTHQIEMDPSTLKTMVADKVYRFVNLQPPSMPQQGPIDAKIARMQGTSPSTRPEDQQYVIYECCCRLVLKDDKEVPGKFIDAGVAVPYRVTIEKQSREVLEIRRDWREDDESCKRIRRYVKYTYVPGFGYYPIGLLQLLGNAANALTALEREGIDAGMFANFPGFLIAKGMTRQLTNELRVAPGSGVAIDTQGGKIGDTAMPLPYHDVTSGLLQLWDKIEQSAQRLGGTAEVAVGDGKQDAPVGTTIALIEQATKLESAVHKRMYKAMSEELQMLVELLREDPEAMWRDNPNCATQWDKDKFLAALQKCNIVPVADPNIPSHLHRIMQAMGLVQLDKQYPGQMNPKWIITSVLRMMKFNADSPDMWAPPQQPQMDPRIMAAMQKANQGNAKIQQDLAQAKMDMQLEMAKLQDGAADRASKEKIEQLKLQMELIRLVTELAVHPESQPIVDQSLAGLPAVNGSGPTGGSLQ